MRRGILGLVCLLALMAGLTGTAQAAKYDNDTVIVKFAGGRIERAARGALQQQPASTALSARLRASARRL